MPPRLSSSLFHFDLFPTVCVRYAPVRTIKSIVPGVHNSRFNRSPNLSTPTASPAAALARKAATLPLRTGALATKTGMSAIYNAETGLRTPCTVVQIDRCQVVSHKTREKNGYFAVQVGCGYRLPRRVRKPELGHFAAHHVAPKERLIEFRVRDKSGLLPVGTTIDPSWFQEGQYVDVRAISRGMGFEGGMKRWGFHGQPASHGNSLTHRALGSAGQSQGGGSRVLPGKKMAGNMGGERVTVQNLRILKVMPREGIVLISGAVPGPRKCIVQIQDAIMKPWPDLPGIPAKLVESKTAT